ncbi:carbohydrate ABC transporter substrate-binding protein (CUT1 family) [Bacillus oleivorans]|uniref:Carbohydrate ABC transporter substrate-binding protein (CUT1 family) n=2 Tax=Bacillus oleivorans TaxID=1448271 RepID=A0A285D2N6_9BACI|nr:extracellular solute-binding protein [Bacillus oleivorans]SNX74080.1 carbohydrate ABC transporter substrate-binding protein (CUT1 family) [Bacillus oleivorans]
MNRMGKIWGLGLFLILLGLLLSACSSENTDGENDSEKVTLTMGSWRTEDTALYQKVIDKFNEQYPNIEIVYSPSKNTEYNTILNTALQGGEGPDIFHLRPYAPGIELADAGYLVPLDDLEGLDVYPDAALQASRGSDGKQYGVPLNISTTQMFYNKKIFEELGLKEPSTWDEFIELNETLLSEGITPIALGTKEGWLLSAAHGMIGPAFYDDAFIQSLTAGEKDFTSDEFVASIKAMDELKKYFPDNYEGLGMEDIRTLFFTEKAAMFPMGSWEIEVLRSMNPDLDFGFFPMPSAIGNEPTVTTWVDGSFAINANSDHIEEAKIFLEFLTTEEFGTLFTEEFKMISAIPGIESTDELVNSLSQAVENSPIPYLILVHFAGGNPSTKVTLETQLQGMYLGEMSPEEVAETVQESAASWFEPFQ